MLCVESVKGLLLHRTKGTQNIVTKKNYTAENL